MGGFGIIALGLLFIFKENDYDAYIERESLLPLKSVKNGSN